MNQTGQGALCSSASDVSLVKMRRRSPRACAPMNRHEVPRRSDTSAIFSAGIQRLSKTMSADEYARQSSASMVTSGLRQSQPISDFKLGNTVFKTFEISGTARSVPFRQVFFVTVRKNVAIFFVETFYDNKNTFAVEAALKTLKFR